MVNMSSEDLDRTQCAFIRCDVLWAIIRSFQASRIRHQACNILSFLLSKNFWSRSPVGLGVLPQHVTIVLGSVNNRFGASLRHNILPPRMVTFTQQTLGFDCSTEKNPQNEWLASLCWCRHSGFCLGRRSSRLSKTWFLINIAILANLFSLVIVHRTWIC